MSSWDHVEITCCTCGAPIMLHRDHEARLRRTHDWFYCPAGHAQHFAGKSKQEKEIDRLSEDVMVAKEDAAYWRDAWDASQETRKVIVHGAQVCPLGCGHVGSRRLPWRPSDEDLPRFFDRVWRDLTGHMVEAHGAAIKVRVASDAHRV